MSDSPRLARGTVFPRGVFACAVCLALMACDDEALAPRPVDAGDAPFGLTPEQAAAVVAKVGDRSITLGDYAAVLERMNEYDRYRYQSKKRRRDLLQDIIDTELLAQEARRRGLDKNPEVQEAIRQVLRDAMKAKILQNVRQPAEVPMSEVRDYYDKHQDQFTEPERRRVSAIVLGDPDKAREVLDKVLATPDDKTWGELFFENSLTAAKQRNPNDPPDLAGDLGMVGPPEDPKGGNDKVPVEVQKVVFDLDKVGDIHDQVVDGGKGRYFIVRLAGISKARPGSLETSEQAIRRLIFQEDIKRAEEQASEDLKKKFKVEIDQDALKAIKLPDALEDYKPFWDEDVGPGPSGSGPSASAPPAASAQPGDE